MGRSLQQPRIRNRAATPDTANTARPADTAGHAAASVVKAGLKPSAGRAHGRGPGVSRPNPLREDRGRRLTVARAMRLRVSAILRSTAWQRESCNREQIGAMHSPDIRNTRRLDYAWPAAASQIVFQGESRTV